MQSLYRDFSHLYIEESCLDYEDTIILSEKFPKSKKIVIKDYKEFFNRPKQNWKSQKKSSKIILAKKKDALLYEGSPAAPNFGFDNFYYNTLVMNCLYDCSYCYLQGMYPSANLVFFVNGEDFMNEVDKKREVESPIYLCISYDSDLLALESLIPLCRRWIEFVNTRPDVFIEIRTKSANFKQINDIKPINNVILAWTISPKEIAKKYETKTPSLESRISSIAAAIESGWNVRICIDPVLKVENWQDHYEELVVKLSNKVDLSKIKDFTVGSFRMQHEYFKKTKLINENVDLFYHDFAKNDGLTSYTEGTYNSLTNFVSDEIKKIVPEVSIIIA